MRVLLGEWIAKEGFSLEQSEIALRRFTGLGKIKSHWGVIKLTDTEAWARSLMTDLEGMWKEGFTTKPLYVSEGPPDPYVDVEGFGAF